MLERSRYSAENCSVGRALDVVGSKWTLLVLREAFYGARRFEEFHDALGCARNLLADRLANLVEEGVLHRTTYREPGQRSRGEYRITDKGRELMTVVLALMDWGDRWAADPDGPPVEVHHRDCGARVHAVLACDDGHDHLTARDTEPRPGPGAVLRTA
jgi:DNA-binding HxlR family transcriptional regulator